MISSSSSSSSVPPQEPKDLIKIGVGEFSSVQNLVNCIHKTIFLKYPGLSTEWRSRPTLSVLCLRALGGFKSPFAALIDLVEKQLLSTCRANHDSLSAARSASIMSYWHRGIQTSCGNELCQLACILNPTVSPENILDLIMSFAKLTTYTPESRNAVRTLEDRIDEIVPMLNFVQTVQAASKLARGPFSPNAERKTRLINRALELTRTKDSIETASIPAIVNGFVDLLFSKTPAGDRSLLDWYVVVWMMQSQMNYEQLAIFTSAICEKLSHFQYISSSTWLQVLLIASVIRTAKLANTLSPTQLSRLIGNLYPIYNTVENVLPTDQRVLTMFHQAVNQLLNRAVQLAPDMNAVEIVHVMSMFYSQLPLPLDSTLKDESIPILSAHLERVSNDLTPLQAQKIILRLEEINKDKKITEAYKAELNHFIRNVVPSVINKLAHSDFILLPKRYFLPNTFSLDSHEAVLARLVKEHHLLEFAQLIRLARLLNSDNATPSMSVGKDLLLEHAIRIVENISVSDFSINTLERLLEKGGRLHQNFERLPITSHRFPALEQAIARKILSLVNTMHPKDAIGPFLLLARFTDSDIRDEACAALTQYMAAASHQSTKIGKAIAHELTCRLHCLIAGYELPIMPLKLTCTTAFLRNVLPSLVQELVHIMDQDDVTGIVLVLNDINHTPTPNLVMPTMRILLPRILQLSQKMEFENLSSILEVASSCGLTVVELTQAWFKTWKRSVEEDEDEIDEPSYEYTMSLPGMVHGCDDLAKEMIDTMAPQIIEEGPSIQPLLTLSVASSLRNLDYPHQPLIEFLRKAATSNREVAYIDLLDSILNTVSPLASDSTHVGPSSSSTASSSGYANEPTFESSDLNDNLTVNEVGRKLHALNQMGHTSNPSAAALGIKALLPRVMQLAESRELGLNSIAATLRIVTPYGINHKNLARLWAIRVKESPASVNPFMSILTAGMVQGCDTEMKEIIDLMAPYVMNQNENETPPGWRAYLGIASALRNLDYHHDSLIAFIRNMFCPSAERRQDSDGSWATPPWLLLSNILRGITRTDDDRRASSSHSDSKKQRYR